ncbi:MAG TPA: carboxypeptidase-like regulatory domain-containing protein, partial [Bryobacteraceae bacterium]|nr:carboxypeptidase-like regulatory domain-containing protein [Bryobacteraceae bacterium]
MPTLKHAARFLVLAVAVGVEALAQESASVVGTVTDSSGAAIPGVNVSITSTTTNTTSTVQTATDGNYTSPPLPPGRYSVAAQAQGFAKTIQTINLDVAQHARLDFSLKPGEISTSVTVEANAAILETQSAELGNVRT